MTPMEPLPPFPTTQAQDLLPETASRMKFSTVVRMTLSSGPTANSAEAWKNKKDKKEKPKKKLDPLAENPSKTDAMDTDPTIPLPSPFPGDPLPLASGPLTPPGYAKRAKKDIPPPE